MLEKNKYIPTSCTINLVLVIKGERERISEAREERGRGEW